MNPRGELPAVPLGMYLPHIPESQNVRLQPPDDDALQDEIAGFFQGWLTSDVKDEWTLYEAAGHLLAMIPKEMPLGLSEIAQLCGVSRRTPEVWRARGVLPEPDGMVSGSPLWWRETVTTWATATGRHTQTS